MSEVAARHDKGKPKLHYILHYKKAVETLCRILEFGAHKYSDFNWKKGGKPDAEYLAACVRHMTKHVNGEIIDPETGCSHIGHAAWNLMTLLELNITMPVDEPLFFKILQDFERSKCNEVLVPASEELTAPPAKASHPLGGIFRNQDDF